jgi:hypothetical protein
MVMWQQDKNETENVGFPCSDSVFLCRCFVHKRETIQTLKRTDHSLVHAQNNVQAQGFILDTVLEGLFVNKAEQHRER